MPIDEKKPRLETTSFSGPIPLTLKLKPSNLAGPQPGDTALLQSEIFTALSQFNLGAQKTIEVVIGRREDGNIFIRTEPTLASAQRGALLSTLQNNFVVGNLLNRNIGQGQRFKTLNARFNLERGTFNADASQISLSQNEDPLLTAKAARPKAASADDLTNLRKFVGNGRVDRVPSVSGSDFNCYSSAAYGAAGQIRAANMFFGGDMEKAYNAALALYADKVVKGLGWRASTVTATQYEALRKIVGNGKVESVPGNSGDFRFHESRAYGAAGQIRVAKEIFEGDMAVAYNAALEAYGEDVLKGLRWKKSSATATQYEALRNLVGNGKVESVPDDSGDFRFYESRAYGAAGQIRVARESFEGDMDATYDAAFEAYGLNVLTGLGWKRSEAKKQAEAAPASKATEAPKGLPPDPPKKDGLFKRLFN